MLQFFLASSPIFAVVALGFVAGRLRLVAPAGFAAFAAYAFDLALPALLVSLLARQPLAAVFDLRFFAALLGAGLVVFVATGASTALLGRAELRVIGAHAQAATTGNLGFLGVPLLLALLGDRATGPLAMGILAEVGLLMPLGIVLMSVRRDRPGPPRGVMREVATATLLNPIVLGVCVGAAVGLSGSRLPAPVDRFLSFLGASAGPTALFALGGSLASRRLGQHWQAIAGVAAAKLLVYPALAWAFLRLAGLPPTWVAAGVLIAALPTAANVFVFAQRFDAVPERISAEILLSTLVGAATFPLAAWLVMP
jgi:malonate transporter